MLVARASLSLFSPLFYINPINKLSLNEENQKDSTKVIIFRCDANYNLFLGCVVCVLSCVGCVLLCCLRVVFSLGSS